LHDERASRFACGMFHVRRDGHEPGEIVSNEAGNKRNGTTSKTVRVELGKLEFSIRLDPTRAPDRLGASLSALNQLSLLFADRLTL
jgi:hypothetical protein